MGIHYREIFIFIFTKTPQHLQLLRIELFVSENSEFFI
jgi:hypothetical protein